MAAFDGFEHNGGRGSGRMANVLCSRPRGLQTKRFLNVQALAGLCRGLQALPFGSAAVLAQMPGPEGHKPASGKGIKTVCHGGHSGSVIHGNARSL